MTEWIAEPPSLWWLLAVIPVISIVDLIVAIIILPPEAHRDREVVSISDWVIFCVETPIVEEFIFRLLPFATLIALGLRQSLFWVIGVLVVASVVFGALHKLNSENISWMFVVANHMWGGLVLGLTFLVFSGFLVYPGRGFVAAVVLHATINAAVLIYYGWLVTFVGLLLKRLNIH